MSVASAVHDSPSVPDDGRRILIVDDDRDFADAMADLLEIHDFVVRTANSAEEAEAVVHSFDPALALVDVKLGASSGLEQITRLRAANPELLCVMVTAYAETETAIDALRRGADDFLRKPLQVEETLAVVYRCLDKRRLQKEKRAAEAQLQRMQKMESIGRLTGGVAHEFNNLLTVVLGNLQLLANALPEDGEHMTRVRAAERAASRGARLTRQLLAYARREPLQPEPVDVGETIATVNELMGATLGEEIRIRRILPVDLWPTQIDPGGLQDALINLCLNARDAMPAGGTITIATRNTHLPAPFEIGDTVLAPGDYVELAVSDSGTGMTEEVLARAFEPFFTTKDVGRGTGLGLSMVQGFAAQSGGAAAIASVPGEGTTVTLYLPRVAPPAADAPVAAEAPAARDETAGGTVLVVEDDADVRLLAVNLLTDLGYTVIEAEHGARALQILDGGEAIDVLFTDIVMPGGVSGQVLWQEARRRRSDIAVVFTSGYNDDVVSHRGALDETAPFVQKPYRRETLARALAAALSRRSAPER